MPWLNPFLLGRPGLEYEFEVNPSAMQIEDAGVVVRQRNLAGDLKKSVVKVSAPSIRISSNYLTLAQRNQFHSLVGVTDSFLSFRTRDDWEAVDERVTWLSSTTMRIANSSAARLSKVLTSMGFPSIITIQTPFKLGVVAGVGYGEGGYGEGGYGSAPEEFDPGTVTYDDATRIITITNPIADPAVAILVSYLYTGWLVDMQVLNHQAQGGWGDRFVYDFQLVGA